MFKKTSAPTLCFSSAVSLGFYSQLIWRNWRMNKNEVHPQQQYPSGPQEDQQGQMGLEFGDTYSIESFAREANQGESKTKLFLSF